MSFFYFKEQSPERNLKFTKKLSIFKAPQIGKIVFHLIKGKHIFESFSLFLAIKKIKEYIPPWCELKNALTNNCFAQQFLRPCAMLKSNLSGLTFGIVVL